MGTGAPAGGRESSTIAEEDEPWAGQYSGGGADKPTNASWRRLPGGRDTVVNLGPRRNLRI